MRNILKEQLKKCMYGEINWPIKNKETYREFKTMQETEKWGMKYYKDWADLYKNTMRRAKSIVKNPYAATSIESYCGNMYREINSCLRNEKNDDERNYYREAADIMTFALCSAPRIPENIVLYRLVRDEFVEELIKLNKGTRVEPIEEKGFMSTSLLKDIIYEDEGYAGHDNILKIYVESGTVGIYANAIAKRGEEEMLLLPGMHLGMANYPYKDHSVGKMVYECKLIKFDI